MEDEKEIVNENLDSLSDYEIEALYSDIIEGPSIMLANKCFCSHYSGGRCNQYTCLY